ncbi:MAG: argininosuccinate lyase [Actinobacteria bacterium]|nr:argininosuccinate lyase [Actinomycetota bacterium]
MKLWGGRFEKNTDKLVEQYTSSLNWDKRLYQYDIRGSLAHVAMLAKCGIITDDEAEKIRDGLNQIFREIKDNQFVFDPSDEDIHMSIERALIEKVGPSGGKLHTARSRNDQVVLDERMYLKDEITDIINSLLNLQEIIFSASEDKKEIILPGYTHLQRAQPVLLAHHLMAYFFMFQRDIERLVCCYKRTDVMPLGSAALAGTSFPIDREFVARQLGFSKISENSMDSVSDRDFIVEFISAVSLVMVHLSKLSEEIILWSSSEFQFVEVDDAYATGSSIMPQKKNADVAELVRSKTGKVFGNLVSLLTTLKALPLAYNRDLQEDKENLFGAVDTVKISLQVFCGMLKTLKFNSEKMKKAAENSFVNATDLADYLVLKGLPFRQAHEVVGRLVKLCLDKNCKLNDLSLEEMQSHSHLIDEKVFDVLLIGNCVESKISDGGTSSKSLEKQFVQSREFLEETKKWVEGKRKT